jgi:hypothetical protein
MREDLSPDATSDKDLPTVYESVNVFKLVSNFLVFYSKYYDIICFELFC